VKLELSQATAARLGRLAEEGGYPGIEAAIEAMLDANATPRYSDEELRSFVRTGRESALHGVYDPEELAAEARALIARKSSVTNG
jgi:hypothetical protein